MKVLEQRQRGEPLAASVSKASGNPAVRSTSATGADISLDRVIAEVAGLFKLLSDETRLRILYSLVQADEHHVRALCDMLNQSQPAVSHHLALLRNAGLISCRRDGKHNFYRLVPRRFGQLLDLAFGSVPPHERRVRFEEYVLSHSPVS